MPVEEAVVGLFGLLARAIVWLFVEMIFYAVCYSVGWAVMKLLTLGKYPNDSTSKYKVSILGMATIMFLLIGFIIFAI